MNVVTLLNEKGGVGKTAISTHLAMGIAMRGFSVVLVDADPQGHATTSLGLEKSPGFYDLLVRGHHWKDVLKVISPDVYQHENMEQNGKLYLCPSNVETRNITNSVDDAFLVSKRLKELRSGVDFVVFDTSPTPSLLHGSIYMATSHMICPTRLETLSFDGLIESFQHRQASNDYRVSQGMKAIHSLGVVPTMYQSVTSEHTDNLRELNDALGLDVWPAINGAIAWAETTRVGKAVWAYAPKSKAADQALGMVGEFFRRLSQLEEGAV